MPLAPDRGACVGSALIDFGPAREGGLHIFRVERRVGIEGVETAAAHIGKLVHQHIAHRAQFAVIARFAQDSGGGITAPVAEGGEIDFDEVEAFEMRDQIARIVARLDADGGGVRLVEKRIDWDCRVRVARPAARGRRRSSFGFY